MSYLPRDINTPLNKYKKQSETHSIIFVFMKKEDSCLIASLVLNKSITSFEKVAKENDTILNKKKQNIIHEKNIVDFLYCSFPMYLEMVIPKYS